MLEVICSTNIALVIQCQCLNILIWWAWWSRFILNMHGKSATSSAVYWQAWKIHSSERNKIKLSTLYRCFKPSIYKFSQINQGSHTYWEDYCVQKRCFFYKIIGFWYINYQQHFSFGFFHPFNKHISPTMRLWRQLAQLVADLVCTKEVNASPLFAFY